MFKKSVIIALISLVANVVYANPAPLGLEIGKATADDVKNKYKVIKQAENINPGYHNYYLDPKDVPFDSVSEVLVVCDEVGIVNYIILNMNKNNFSNIVKMLSEKYQVVKQNIPHVGDKYVKFQDNDCTIEVAAPHMSFDMSLFYLTSKLQKASDERLAKEEAEKQVKEKSML